MINSVLHFMTLLSYSNITCIELDWQLFLDNNKSTLSISAIITY